MATVQQIDAEGYAVPWPADDECIECGLDDPSWGEPESWPAWTDGARWEEGPAIPPDAAIEPFEPSEDDLADYAEWSAELGRGFPPEYPAISDADLAAAGLAV